MRPEEIDVLMDKTRECKQVVRYDAATDVLIPRGEKPPVDTVYVSKKALEEAFGLYPRAIRVTVKMPGPAFELPDAD